MAQKRYTRDELAGILMWAHNRVFMAYTGFHQIASDERKRRDEIAKRLGLKHTCYVS